MDLQRGKESEPHRAEPPDAPHRAEPPDAPHRAEPPDVPHRAGKPRAQRLAEKQRAQRLAGKRGGRITYRQLREVGLTPDEIRGWIASGILIRTRPGVYALGYVRTDLEARLWEAVLYAGPDAYLTGASGAHQRQLINYPPRDVTVATPRKCKSLPGIVVHRERPARRELYAGLPVAPIPELMLALAAEGDLNLVRKALANLEYRRQLDVGALLRVCGHGRRGSALLRRALERRLPQLAYTNSPLEDDFVILLDDHRLPLPHCNVRVHGILVDTYWPQLGLVVELDGDGNHGTAAQKRRDARDMAILRGHGLTVLRFDSDDVHLRVAALLSSLAAVGVVCPD